jgi:hypothetical protein
MNNKIYKLVLASTGLTFSLLSSAVSANTLDCQNLYVGRIWIEQGQGLQAVVFLDHPDNSSGSYFQFFTHFSPDEKKQILALLTAAKLMQHRVHITTEEADGCGIQTNARYVKGVVLANNP